MYLIVKLLIFACLASIAFGSKLNLPRVLLPLFKSSPTNFTLKVTNNGCYTWTLSRLDVVQVIPLNLNKQLDCSSEVLLTTITKEFTKNTVIVLVEEVTTKEVLRCDVIVDVISSLHIVTKTRQLFVEESPEIFEVRAYDAQGNEFSTLEGVQFIWTVSSGNPYDLSSKNDVLRFINFKDSFYEIPPTIRDLDSQGLKGHMVLLEGVKTGTANVSVELSQHEYRSVPAAVVQLNVIANLLIEPSDSYILQGDVIYYKLLQVKNGRFVEVPLPSNQYSLIIEDETIARQLRPWVIEALSVGQTKLMLSDVNSKTSNFDHTTYLPSVNLKVVIPSYMNLVALPHKSWVTATHLPNIIVAELFDSNNHKIHIGPYAIIKINIDKRFRVGEVTKNGSVITGYSNEKGIIPIQAEFSSVRTNENVLIPFNALNAKADLLVYDPLSINPPEIRIPWDPKESPKLNYPLNVTGGDGFYQWSVADSHIAIVTQSGNVKPRNIGHTKVTVTLPSNQALQASAKIVVQPPSKLAIVRTSIESEVGSSIFLAIALYYNVDINGIKKPVLFSNCTGFPFSVRLHNSDFYYNSTSHARTPSNACTTIGVVGKAAGNSVVTVSYLIDGLILKDTVTVSAYEPLQILSPNTGQTVLSVGAQRYIVFIGGPSRSSTGHRVVNNNDDSVISIQQTYDGHENERIFLVTCQALGKGFISLEALSLVKFEGLITPQRQRVDVICTHPKSFTLSADVLDTKSSACPSIFHGSNVVLNNKPVVITVTIKDEEGNVFDNATSLDVKWTLSNEELGEIDFQGAIKLQEENKLLYKLPLYHYQIITPALKIGDLVVTAKIVNYKKSWLKRLSINWEDKNFKINDLQESLSLTLVNNVRVSPEFISLFNHAQNIAKFQITHGSGFYNVSSSAGNIAQINFSEVSKTVEIVPYLPGTFNVMIKDECLNSEPVTAEILILTITQINVDALDKVEKGKSIKAFLTLVDSEGNIVTKNDMPKINVETDSNAIYVDCSNVERNRLACTVNGVELGHSNLVFSSGIGESIVRSKAVRIQVYPPLQLLPKNVTLIPGASIQLIAKGGPQPHCVIEFSVKNGIIKVDHAGNVLGKEIGETYVVGSAVEVKASGEKIVYSSDTIRVNVVHLNGIRIKTPLTTIKTNAKMPIWVSGIPEQISPLVLASVFPSLSFKWDVSSPDIVSIIHIFDDTGVKIADTDKISMRVNSLKKGNVAVSVNVTAPRSIRNLARDGRHVFVDSINIKVFDELQITNHIYNPLLLPPTTTYDLKTNKDMVSRISFNNNIYSHKRISVFEVNDKGIVSTSNVDGVDCVAVTSIEEEGISQNAVLCVEVASIKYVMLNVIPELQVHPESSVFGLPRGIRLQFEVSYHDNYGRRFASIKNYVKLQLSKIDKVLVSENENNRIIIYLLDYGVTVLKLYDEDSSLMPDFMKINTVPYIQPDKVKLVVGDVICFNTPTIISNDHACQWNSSNDNTLSINKQTGYAVAKSEQTNVVITYQCSEDLKIVTTADIYSLQKVEIIANKVVNISNNGKRYVVPIRLINRADELEAEEKTKQFTKHCDLSDVAFFPYECEIKFDEGSGSGSSDVNTIFSTYPNFDSNGHSCVINSNNINTPQLSKLDTNVILRVTWGRYQSTSVSIPFKPALFLDTTKLIISDEKTTDYIRLVGLPSVLDNVKVIPSDSKFIAIKEESVENKNIAKYSVYIKPAFLKIAHCPACELSISVVSEQTEQNVTVPIGVNVNAERYSVPSDLSEKVNQFVEDYSFKIVVSSIIALIIYLIVVKIYYKKLNDDIKDHSMRSMDLSHNRSHLSDHSSPGLYTSRYRQPPIDQMQLIYGRSPDRIGRKY